jgi:hypothetical protein
MSIKMLLSNSNAFNTVQGAGVRNIDPGYFVLSMSGSSGNAIRLSGCLVLENGTVVIADEKKKLEQLLPLSEKLINRILGKQIGRELLHKRNSIPISEEQMATLHQAHIQLFETNFGAGFERFITEGSYEKQIVAVAEGDDTIAGFKPVKDNQYNLQVTSGYISFVFFTWNYTYIQPAMVGQPEAGELSEKPIPGSDPRSPANSGYIVPQPRVDLCGGWRFPGKTTAIHVMESLLPHKNVVYPAHQY